MNFGVSWCVMMLVSRPPTSRNVIILSIYIYIATSDIHMISEGKDINIFAQTPQRLVSLDLGVDNILYDESSLLHEDLCIYV